MKKYQLFFYCLIISFELITYKSFSQAVNAGIIGTSQTICSSETPAPLTTTIPPSGGSGQYNLQWQSHTGDGSWGNEQLATMPTFSPGAQYWTIYYRKRVIDVATGDYYYTNEVIITVNQFPGTPTAIVGPTERCMGTGTSSYTTSAAYATSYNWSLQDPQGCTINGNGPTGTITWPPTFTGSHLILVHAVNSCGTSQNAMLSVNVHSLPTAFIQESGPLSFPPGGSVELTASAPLPGYTFLWSTGVATQSIIVTTTGSYSVTAYYDGCLATSDPTIVTVYPPLNAGTIGASQTICSSETPAPLTTTIPPSGGSGQYDLQWQSHTGDGSWGNEQLATMPTFSPGAQYWTIYYRKRVIDVATGDYYYTNEVIITVNQFPTSPTTGSNIPSPTQIIWNWNTVTGATGYKWNTTNDYSTATDMGSATTNTETGLTCNTAYSRYVWAYSACGNSVATTLTQMTIQAGIPEIAGSNYLCLGTMSTYYTEPRMINYQWTVSPDGNVASGGATSDNYITIDWVSSGSKVVTVLYTNPTGCSPLNPSVKNITVHPSPLPVITSPEYIGGFNISCNGENDGTIILTVNSGTLPYLFTWSNGEVTQNLTGLNAGNYSVTVTDANSCSASNSIALSEPTLLLADAGPNKTICFGTGKSLGGGLSTGLGGVGPYSYSWSPSAGLGSTTMPNPIASPLVTTTYSLTVTDQNNCTATSTVDVVVKTRPVVSISAIPSNNIYTGGVPTTICLGYGPQSVTLESTVNGGSGFNYSWTGTPLTIAGLSSTTCANPVFTPTEEGRYNFTLTVTNSDGCSATAAITICVMDIQVPGSNNRVYLCHNTGKPKTKAVNVNAVPAHVPGHPNDFLGKCDQSCDNIGIKSFEETGESIVSSDNLFSTIVYPNPFTSDFTITVETDSQEVIWMNIYDLTGRLLQEVKNIQPYTPVVVANDLTTGFYVLHVHQGIHDQKVKIIKKKE